MGREVFLQNMGPTLTLEQVGEAVVSLATDPGHDHDAYRLTHEGMESVA